MNRVVCWLPGWASDFSLWHDTIHARWPDAEHLLVSFPEMLAHKDSLHTLPQMRRANLVVGWSLGSLLALRASAQLPALVPIVALCPIAWFCHPELGWPLRVVQRMSQKLAQDPQSILAAFAERMGPADPEMIRKWVARASQFSTAELKQGLEILATDTVPAISKISLQRPIHLIAGCMDEVVSPESTVWLDREMHPQSFQVIPNMSHWPFSGQWELPHT